MATPRRGVEADGAQGHPAGGHPAGRGRTPQARGGTPKRPSPRATGTPVPAWAPWLSLALSLVGLGIATYLTLAHYTSTVPLACPNTGVINCARVTTSPQSVMLGIPVAVLGLAWFVVMVAITTPYAWRHGGVLVGRARVALAALGMAFVLYLVYTELFVLDSICLWCTGVHVVTLLLFAIITLAASATQQRASQR